MSRKDVQRLEVIRRVRQQGLAQAAHGLGLSARQVKRLCRREREEGSQGSVKAAAPREALAAGAAQALRARWLRRRQDASSAAGTGGGTPHQGP